MPRRRRGWRAPELKPIRQPRSCPGQLSLIPFLFPISDEGISDDRKNPTTIPTTKSALNDAVAYLNYTIEENCGRAAGVEDAVSELEDCVAELDREVDGGLAAGDLEYLLEDVRTLRKAANDAFYIIHSIADRCWETPEIEQIVAKLPGVADHRKRREAYLTH